LVIANMQVTGSQDTAIVLSSISGGQVTDNHLIDPQLRGDATLAAIEIHDSRDLSGTGNTVEHTNSWKGRSWGPIRSVNSWQVTVTAQMVQ
jgi:hypothetical protein